MVKIEKESLEIVAYVHNFKIKGTIFTPPGGRLSDFLSGVSQRQFIPVTDAIVSDVAGNEICRTKFLELNREEILFLFPLSDQE